MLKAAIEDARTKETTKVADAALAVYLARVLNDLDAGRPLPPRGQQHRPPRFQVVRDPAFGTPGAGVAYVHGLSQRLLVDGPSEEVAHSVTRILNHVDYPMYERRSRLPWSLPPPPLVGSLGELPRRLPPPSVAKQQRPARPGARAALPLAIVLWSATPVAAALALTFYMLGWRVALVAVSMWIVVMALALRRARR